jgi:hypothetical protein
MPSLPGRGLGLREPPGQALGPARAAGMPCPDCNEPGEGERPAMSDDFIPAFDRDKGPVH